MTDCLLGGFSQEEVKKTVKQVKRKLVTLLEYKNLPGVYKKTVIQDQKPMKAKACIGNRFRKHM